MHTLEDIRQMKNIKHYKPPLKSSIGIYKKKRKVLLVLALSLFRIWFSPFLGIDLSSSSSFLGNGFRHFPKEKQNIQNT
jgi:hypothetical protein